MFNETRWCNSRMSLRAVTCGNLGMHYFGTFRHFNCFEKLHAFVRRNRLTIGDQTTQINIDSVTYHVSCFGNRFSPRVTSWKGRDECVIPAFIRIENYAIRIRHDAIITFTE